MGKRNGRDRLPPGSRSKFDKPKVPPKQPRARVSPLRDYQVRFLETTREAMLNRLRENVEDDCDCPICAAEREAAAANNEGNMDKKISPDDDAEGVVVFHGSMDDMPSETMAAFAKAFGFTIPISGSGKSETPRKGETAEQCKLRVAAQREEQRLRPGIEKYLLKTEHQLGWDDVVGNDAAKLALVEAIEQPVVHASLFAHYGKQIGKGVLLYGPPGCGKTMFAKAAASRLAALHKASEVPTLLVINGPSIQSPYVGVTEGIIRNIFAYARVYRAAYGYPLTIFVDEADSILPSRDGAGGRPVHSWEESNVATFLTEMDGMETSGAFVIIATNRPHMIDNALLRDGRCDRKIKVERPTLEAARIILHKALRGAPLVNSDPALGAVQASQQLAGRVAEEFYADWNAVLELFLNPTDKPVVDYLRLRDIVNGAMLVGLVEKAKGVAFQRDLRAGQITGLRFEDFVEAIRVLKLESEGMNHQTALEEYAERTPATQFLVRRLQKRSINELNA